MAALAIALRLSRLLMVLAVVILSFFLTGPEMTALQGSELSRWLSRCSILLFGLLLFVTVDSSLLRRQNLVIFFVPVFAWLLSVGPLDILLAGSSIEQVQLQYPAADYAAISLFILIAVVTAWQLDTTILPIASSIICCYALWLFDSRDAILAWIALLAAIAILTEVFERAWLDSLTRLPGRDRLDSDVDASPVGAWAIFIDIDYFKRFNDQYGHLNGDHALTRTAKTLRSIRGLSAYRFGGEEFVLLCQSGSQERLAIKLENLRAKLEADKFLLRYTSKRGKRQEKRVNITISLGATQRQRSDTRKTWLKRADAALYKAKSKGRNQVVFD
ncbi:MAG: GGDEF domain-containing protein [Gammaproteobacteria bacterium]|nr:GGDEF domain-containing protein [Gammaproteobacteria bacterium]